MDFGTLERSVWAVLREETRPILLYGMGDGADKILAQFDICGIRASGVFASDEFVRGHSFHGFRVLKLSEALAQFGEDIVIVIAFASQRPEVLDKMYTLDAKYTVYAPDVPVVPGPVFDEAFIQSHADEMQAAFDLLADEQSRRVFLDTVRFKLSGKLQYLRASEIDKDEAFHTILRPTHAEHFADLGAYTGDTIRELLHYTNGAFASVTALEPDRRSFRKLTGYAQTLMDVEGAEYEALQGAEQTIRQYRPKLNLAAYHRSADFFALPLAVHALCPDYRLYLRHHPYVPAWDTNLYAVCP